MHRAVLPRSNFPKTPQMAEQISTYAGHLIGPPVGVPEPLGPFGTHPISGEALVGIRFKYVAKFVFKY